MRVWPLKDSLSSNSSSGSEILSERQKGWVKSSGLSLADPLSAECEILF